jgi:molecular chaperone GrpE
MTEDTTQNPDHPETPDQAPADGDATVTPDQQVAQLQVEMADLNARFLRVSADYQNYARRSQSNIVEARQQQTMEMARGLLGVLDHFDRALEADPTRVSAQSLLDGVRIVRDELMKLLEKYGVSRIEVKPGDPFNPALHEALMHQPAEGIEPGAIAGQLQPGYMLGDRTLRPAKVSVAS